MNQAGERQKLESSPKDEANISTEKGRQKDSLSKSKFSKYKEKKNQTEDIQHREKQGTGRYTRLKMKDNVTTTIRRQRLLYIPTRRRDD